MAKLSIASLLLSFLICYLEWGQGNSSFVYEVEYQVLFQREATADTFTHPIILLPFCGQLLLVLALFQQKPNRKLVLTGIILMGLLVVLLFVIGLLGKNPKIALSTVPFLLSAGWYAWKRGA